MRDGAASHAARRTRAIGDMHSVQRRPAEDSVAKGAGVRDMPRCARLLGHVDKQGQRRSLRRLSRGGFVRTWQATR